MTCHSGRPCHRYNDISIAVDCHSSVAHTNDSTQATGVWRCEWTLTNNLTLIFQALSHHSSSRTYCNINGDMHSKQFLSFNANQLVSAFLSWGVPRDHHFVSSFSLLCSALWLAATSPFRTGHMLSTHVDRCIHVTWWWLWSGTHSHPTKTWGIAVTQPVAVVCRLCLQQPLAEYRLSQPYVLSVSPPQTLTWLCAVLSPCPDCQTCIKTHRSHSQSQGASLAPALLPPPTACWAILRWVLT